MATQLRGKAPLTQVRTETGQIAFVRVGAPAPSNLSDEDRKRLIEEGYLEEVEVEQDPGSEDDTGADTEDGPKTAAKKTAAKKS